MRASHRKPITLRFRLQQRLWDCFGRHRCKALLARLHEPFDGRRVPPLFGLRAVLRAVLVSTALTTTTFAADITKTRIESLGLDLIFLSGPIQEGDAQRFEAVASSSKKAMVVLNSEGGLALEGLEIGRTVRRRGAATSVPREYLCASSCALIWLAGKERFAEDDSHIGFHAVYIERNGVYLESGVGNALVGAYLNQLGLSQSSVIYVTSAPPQGIRWLTREDAARIDLPYLSLFAGTDKNVLSPAVVSAAGVAKYDPVSVARSFYSALAKGDGVSASTLVIPEKRGIGPFSELEISRFFGGLQVPLVVEDIRQTGENTVNVRYRYSKDSSRYCKGNAVVTTINKYGKTLIEKIAANC